MSAGGWADPVVLDVEPIDARRMWLGEGGRWTGAEYRQVDLLSGIAYVAAGERGPLTEVLRDERPVGVVLERDGGGFVVVVGTGVATWDGTGALEMVVAPLDAASPARRVNDANADAWGRLWVGSMEWSSAAGLGSLLRVDRDGSVTEVVPGLTCPNWPAFSPDGRTLYLAESATRQILAFELDEDGSLRRRRVFAENPEGTGLPDGLTVDDEGCVWAALWSGSRIARFAPDGRLLTCWSIPARQPTSVCLTGATLLITTGQYEMTDPGPLDGATLAASMPVGAPPAARVRLDR